MAAALAGVGLIPSISHELGPTQIAMSAALGGGETTLRVPPLGTISASTHPAPLKLDLSFRTVDFEELGPLATTSAGRVELRAQMEKDLARVVRRSALQLALGGALIAGVVTVLLWGRRWRYLVAGASGGLVGLIALMGVTGASYDMAAFEEPRYSGTLARAPVVIETLRERAGVLDELRGRYETATERLSDLLVLVAQPDVDPRTDTTAILHVGDIHANPLGLEIAEQLADAFQVDAVVDSGDMGSNTLDTGSLSSLTGPIDRTLADTVDDIEAPYLYVRGNHDAPTLLNRLGAVDNVQILNREVTEVSGLRILGWDDPTFTTDSDVTQEDKDAARLAEAPEVAALVEEEQPDMLIVHDERLAGESYGSVPLVLAGHTHSRGLEEIEGTLILTVGTTGATGLKSLTLETDRNYEAQVIYFREETPVAVDYITFEGISNDFQVERTTLDEPEPIAEPTEG
jgi:predicted phosphodiesterase